MDMETEQKFYVYVDYREDDGRPFYVGKGLDKRVKLEKRNPLHTNIKNKHGMVRKIVLETRSEQDAFNKEIELIQELKTHIDFGEGGANLTLGGEGISGMCEVIRKKMSESMKKSWEEDHERKENHSEFIKKLWEDPEFKEKWREASEKIWEDPLYRKKLSAINKKMWEDPKHKKKVSEAQKKKWEDPERVKNHHESMKKVWEDPEVREKKSKSMKKRFEDPDFKKKWKEANKKVWEDPELKKKVSENSKKMWEKRRLKILNRDEQIPDNIIADPPRVSVG